MKQKVTCVLVVLLLMCPAAACSPAEGNSASTTEASAEVIPSLPLENQLLIGTLQLEDTPLAVTEGQASQLLPLWQVLRSLETSGTAAAEEIEAVLAQVQTAMTKEQLEAIGTMELTGVDQDRLLISLGLEGKVSQTEAASALSSSFAGEPGLSPQSGGMPGGAPPTGEGLASVGGVSLPQEDSQALTGTSQAFSALMEALIQVLEARANG